MTSVSEDPGVMVGRCHYQRMPKQPQQPQMWLLTVPPTIIAAAIARIYGGPRLPTIQGLTAVGPKP